MSWAPAGRAGSLVGKNPGGGGEAARRFASGGSDCAVKIWEWRCVFPHSHSPSPSLPFLSPPLPSPFSSPPSSLSPANPPLLAPPQPPKFHLHPHAHPPRPHRLGARHSLGALLTLKILHRVLQPGQNGADLDVRAQSQSHQKHQ